MGHVFCYDGSIGGLLTLLGRLLEDRIMPEAICIKPPRQQGLFGDLITIATDDERAETFWRELSGRLPPSSLRHLRLACLANREGYELLIFRYLQLAWRSGRRIGGMLAHPDVVPLWKLAQQVGREAHRYLGFVRFQEVSGGYYYAAIRPDHRILPLIAPHFASRFSDQDWVIHDVGHDEGIVHDRQRRHWLLLIMEAHAMPDLAPSEEQFQALWQHYFTTLSIRERENRRLQQAKVPLKVRHWLVEFGQNGIELCA